MWTPLTIRKSNWMYRPSTIHPSKSSWCSGIALYSVWKQFIVLCYLEQVVWGMVYVDSGTVCLLTVPKHRTLTQQSQSTVGITALGATMLPSPWSVWLQTNGGVRTIILSHSKRLLCLIPVAAHDYLHVFCDVNIMYLTVYDQACISAIKNQSWLSSHLINDFCSHRWKSFSHS